MNYKKGIFLLCLGLSMLFGRNASAQLTITLSGVINNVSCNGGSNGSAYVIAIGLFPPYTYSWAPSGGSGDTATGLAAGTYTITVEDAISETTSTSVTITQPNAVSVSSSTLSNVTCNGASTGSASASISGGTSPYTYSWSPTGGSNSSASGLSAGTYTVNVTDSCGGTASAPATITQPAVLGLSISVINVSCHGGSNGSASAVLTGGTSPYTYLWADGATTSSINGLGAGSYTLTVTDVCGASASASASVTAPAALSLSPSVTANVTCNGGSNGSASANLSGGTSPYTYSWTNLSNNANATGLSAGSYTVTVTDACSGTASASVSITQPIPLAMSASVTANVSCNGSSTGSASSTVTGGTLPYTYTWTNGTTSANATGLSAGSYTVTIEDNCSASATASVTITQPVALAITATVTANITCNGGSNGSASSNASNGTSPYVYSWTNGGTSANISGLTAGGYTVTVKDNCGASASAKVTITQPNALSVLANVASNVTCNGGDNGQASANVNGGTLPYTYTWNNGETVAAATGLSAGTYTVTIEDNCGATVSAITVISQPNPLSITANVVANVSCNSGNTGQASSTVLGGTSPYAYTWTNGVTSANATGLTAGNYTISVQDYCGSTASATVALTQPNALSVAATTLSNVSCYGGNTGSASASISGGTSSYTYSWTPSGGNSAIANGLGAGVYTVTVTDSCGSSLSATTTITQPVALAVSATVLTQVNCNGANTGSASSVTSGGTTPYVYSWAPSGGNNAVAIGLTAGSYTITATDACGASVNTTITITQPNPLAISAGVTANNTCYGQYNGAATSQVSGGTGPYIYNWSPTGGHGSSISSVAAGIYTVTVFDACGASVSATATITQPTQLNISATTLTNIACYGQNTGSATSSANGGKPPYVYLWSNGSTNVAVNGLIAGNYTVEVVDVNGCTNTAVSIVTQPTAINATARIQEANGNNGAIWLSVNGGVSPYAYFWYPGGSMADSITSVGAGNYCCIITDNNGCADTVCNTISSDLGVDNLASSAGHIAVYPNPNNGEFTIQSSVANGQWAVEVYNMLGEKVYSNYSITNTSNYQINLSGQPNGIYLYRVLSNDNGNLLGEGKVIVQK